VDVYTLEVTPEDGEKLALASTLGRLQLSLRNVSDSETILTTGADISKTLDSFRPENNHRPPRKAARPVAGSPPVKEKPVLSVELIKGTRVSEIKY